jgi:hypothetical protein
MGQNISAVIQSNDREDENARRQKEQLELTMKLADARLDKFEEELKNMFLDRGSSSQKSVVGKRAIRFERSVLVDAESKVSYRLNIPFEYWT